MSGRALGGGLPRGPGWGLPAGFGVAGVPAAQYFVDYIFFL
jgi:hypothetical protein